MKLGYHLPTYLPQKNNFDNNFKNKLSKYEHKFDGSNGPLLYQSK
jgi:hypothetical protein